MFLKLLNLCRKIENIADSSTRPVRSNESDHVYRNNSSTHNNNAQNNSAKESARIPESGSGRDSFTKLKAVARSQKQENSNAAGHWFHRESNQVIGGMPLDPASEVKPSICVSEEQRQRAIDELLSIGADHFSARKSD